MNLLLLICIALPAATLAQDLLGIRDGTCPDTYEQFGDRCYFFSDEPLLYDAAVTACKARGAELVSLSDTDESAFIEQLIGDPSGNGIWVDLRDFDEKNCPVSGGVDCTRNSAWTWGDNTLYDFALTPPTTAYWLETMPANGRHCGVVKVLAGVFGLAAYGCTTDTNRYLCEKLAPKRQCNCTFPAV